MPTQKEKYSACVHCANRWNTADTKIVLRESNVTELSEEFAVSSEFSDDDHFS